MYGVNNAGDYAFANQPTDTLYSKAVAFSLKVADTSHSYASNYDYFKKAFSFKQAYATSISFSYIPSESVESVTIYSLFDINTSIKTGDVINDYLLYISVQNNGLYDNFDKIYANFNGEQNSMFAIATLVLRTEVENTMAQFKAEVVLDDGNTLTTTSPIFTIIPSEL